jgi:predicted O-linked N-acetylglucosamine transferase (SPINDLY family)
MADYLARHRRADLFLDTLPYAACGTAYHALLAGLPLLTCVGETFAGRTAGAILHAAGLSELVTHSLAEYENLALRLTQTPELLADLRRRVEQARTGSPLFDPARCARDCEAAYSAMWRIWLSGESPRAFSLSSVD